MLVQCSSAVCHLVKIGKGFTTLAQAAADKKKKPKTSHLAVSVQTLSNLFGAILTGSVTIEIDLLQVVKTEVPGTAATI